MFNIKKLGSGLLLVAVVGVGAFGATSVTAKPPRGGGGGGGGCNCLDVWQPVICSNGVVYSNYCYASCAKASGCVPYGDDSI